MHQIHQPNHLFHLKILNLVLNYFLILHINQNTRHIFCQSLLYLYQLWCYQNLLFHLPLFPRHFSILVIISIISTFHHLNRGSVIWTFLYYVIKGIPMIFVFVLCNISVYYTFIFTICCFCSLNLFVIYTFLCWDRGRCK